jgi:hypothetical protein
VVRLVVVLSERSCHLPQAKGLSLRTIYTVHAYHATPSRRQKRVKTNLQPLLLYHEHGQHLPVYLHILKSINSYMHILLHSRTETPCMTKTRSSSFNFPFLECGVRNRRRRWIRLGGPAFGAETLCSFYLAPRFLSFSAIPKRGGIGCRVCGWYNSLLTTGKTSAIGALCGPGPMRRWDDG